MKHSRRILSLVLLLALLLTSLPYSSLADPQELAQVETEERASVGSSEIFKEDTPNPTADTPDDESALNKYEVRAVKGEDADSVKNPAQPKTYTVGIRYLHREAGQEDVQLWQPYIATVGEKKDGTLNREAFLPDLASFARPAEPLDHKNVVSWQFVKDHDGEVLEHIYTRRNASIKVNHQFQSLTNPDVFEDADPKKVTEQEGQVGELIKAEALEEADRPGFEPEDRELLSRIPSSRATDGSKDVEINLHYIRKTYYVHYDSKGGTERRTKRLYFEQTIPAVEDPTMDGAVFQGWSADCELRKTDGTTLPANTLISEDDFKSLCMPAQDVKFTAQWQTNATAEYVVLFWTEKSDYDDKNPDLPLRDRYDYVGLKVMKDQPVGESADLSAMDPAGLKFPDIDRSVTSDAEQLKKYYHINKEVTKEANKDEYGNAVVTKPDGTTVYNLYYDRAVYELVFEKSGYRSSGLTFNPIIQKNGQSYDATVNPYIVRARYYQSLVGLWPRDEEITNWSKGQSGQGWIVNYQGGSFDYVDSPPYRLTDEEFIQYLDNQTTSVSRGTPLAPNQISLGIASAGVGNNHPVHVDFEKEGFDGSSSLDYSMYYWKSDTKADAYVFPAPVLKGFTSTNTYQTSQKRIGQRQNNYAEKAFERNVARNNSDRPDDKKIRYQPMLGGRPVTNNGYLLFTYRRNFYELYLNNDPGKAKETGGFEEGDHFPVLYDRPLKDLNLDTTHVPKRPADVPEDYEFKGWALDAAGAYLVKDGNETMPNYNKTLFAKWGPPDQYWTVTFDPNGGAIDAKTGATTKTVLEGSMISKKKEPTRPGYDFMDWELVIYKKDKDGRYIVDGEGNKIQDTSYKDSYGVPALYAFENPVVEDVYLKANWVDSKTTTATVQHLFYDQEGNKLDDLAESYEIPSQRIGSQLSASATYHGKVKDGQGWILQGEGEDPENRYFKVLTLDQDPEKNVFTFKYRPFRQRAYTVRYLDEAGNPLLEEDRVVNQKQDYDARNYRPIKGYCLVGEPQQQLVFDLDTDGNLLGINGTGESSITFTYKDVRLLERDSRKDVTPDGYHRIIFQPGEHGEFPDKKSEYVYDAVDGLKFGRLPQPQPAGRDGYTFAGWQEVVPDGETAIKRDYIFVAQWEKEVDVTYRFQGPEDHVLPEEVMNQLPQPEKKKVGAAAEKPTAGFDPIEISEGDDQ